jgi:hypothetical protein
MWHSESEDEEIALIMEISHLTVPDWTKMLLDYEQETALF